MLNPPSRAPSAAGNLLDAGACLLAGLLMALCAGWPAAGSDQADAAIDMPALAHAAWWLQGLAVVLFYGALVRGCGGLRPRSMWRTAFLAAVFGLGWQVGTVCWLHIGMHKYAGLGAAWSVAAVLALGAYLTSYTVLASLWFAAAHHRISRRFLRYPLTACVARATAFAAAWLLAELGRVLVMTGFPWAASGYAHLHGPLRGLAPWLGVYGTGAVAAFLAAFLAALLAHSVAATVAALRRPIAVEAAPRAKGAALLALAVAAALMGAQQLADAEFTRSSGEFEVSLLQGNVSQEGKFEPALVTKALDWHTFALLRSQADLALTPETAFPVLEQTLPAHYLQSLRQRTEKQQGVMLIGIPHGAGPQGQRNSLLGLGHADSLLGVAEGAPKDTSNGGLYRYDKQHLVPFAEFTPPGFAWFTQRLNLPLPTFVQGLDAPQPLRLRTRSGPVQTLAPLVCFEDLFGEELALRFRQPDQAPTALTNSSNMAWFDDSPALAQHLRIAQYRSLEFQRPTVRATNTGPTVVINHQGQVTRALPLHTQGVLNAVVEGRSGLTPYAWWVSRTGLWPLVLLAGLVLAWPFLRPCGAPAAG